MWNVSVGKTLRRCSGGKLNFLWRSSIIQIFKLLYGPMGHVGRLSISTNKTVRFSGSLLFFTNVVGQTRIKLNPEPMFNKKPCVLSSQCWSRPSQKFLAKNWSLWTFSIFFVYETASLFNHFRILNFPHCILVFTKIKILVKVHFI